MRMKKMGVSLFVVIFLFCLSAGPLLAADTSKEVEQLKSSPLLMPYANRVREFLEEITARSGGKIRLQIIDPQPFSDDEDRAAEAGLQSVQANDGGESLYFGLVGTNSTDGRASIPSFQPEREEFLEYDVAKLIQELAHPKKPVVGLLSSIPMQGQFNPMTGQMGDTWPCSRNSISCSPSARSRPRSTTSTRMWTCSCSCTRRTWRRKPSMPSINS